MSSFRIVHVGEIGTACSLYTWTHFFFFARDMNSCCSRCWELLLIHFLWTGGRCINVVHVGSKCRFGPDFSTRVRLFSTVHVRAYRSWVQSYMSACTRDVQSYISLAIHGTDCRGILALIFRSDRASVSTWWNDSGIMLTSLYHILWLTGCRPTVLG